VYTTHQAAQLLGVSLPTVVSWIEQGLIDAWRTPGGHRRIPAASLRGFAEGRGIRVEALRVVAPEPGPLRVLVAAPERDLGDLMAEALSQRVGCSVRVADGGFSAAVELGRFVPQIVVLDVDLPEVDVLRFPRLLRADPELRAIQLIALLRAGVHPTESRLREAGYAGVVPKPLQLDRLCAVVAMVAAPSVAPRAG
jgi:excisionase family DNA binding protein